MGRGKVQLKRIENKSLRQATFSKRQRGLLKKAQELAVLCDVEIAMIIFSSGGQLYEFCSGDSMRKILERYYSRKNEEAELYKMVHGTKVDSKSVIDLIVRDLKRQMEHGDLNTCTNLLQFIQRMFEDNNIKQVNIIQLIQLEQQLSSMLRETGLRKTQLMVQDVTALHQMEQQLIQENYPTENLISETSNCNPLCQVDNTGVMALHNHHAISGSSSSWNHLI